MTGLSTIKRLGTEMAAKLQRFGWRVCLICLGLAFSVGPLCAKSFDYVLFDRVLSRVVDDVGRVDYAAVKKDTDFKAFIQKLS